MDAMKKQSRKVLLTINNPSKHGITTEKVIAILDSMKTIYYCISEEIAKTGTEHIHVFVYTKSPIKFATIQNRFPTAHILFSRGSIAENREYVSKTGKWEGTEKAKTSVKGSFYESGDVPTEAANMSYSEKILAAIKAGKSNAEIIDDYPSAMYRIRDMDAYRQEVLKETKGKEIRDITVTYLYGKPGSRKIQHIYDRHDIREVFRISANGNGKELMFDDYDGDKVLVLEDFYSQISINELIKYLDGYPLYLRARYVNRVACYTDVYLVSDEPLEAQYRELRIHHREEWEVFRRYINKVEECLLDGTIRVIEE
ncbi:Putative viral replication protein [uncultured Clostridium sp.]|nr:Putative viral replication protein [uncultured Clostridium sp.]